MTDESLRALERAAAADPSRTLALAKALDRAGRTDAAWSLLCRAIDQPDVRAELATRPAWTHVGGPGRSRSLDVPPVRRAPRVRWRARVRQDHPLLLASSLGVFSLGRRAIDEQLDPRDGRLIRLPVVDVTKAWLDGGLLLAEGAGPANELYAWDQGASAEVPRVEGIRARDWPWLHRLKPGLLPGRDPLLIDGRPFGFPPEHLGTELPLTRLDGGDGRVLTWAATQEPVATGFEATIAGGWLVLSIQRARTQELFGFDLARDVLAWRTDGVAVGHDAAGVLVQQRQAGVERLVLLGHDGTERWAVEHLQGIALGPGCAIALASVDFFVDPLPTEELVVLDRATGARRAGLAPLHGRPVHHPVVAIVRDLVVVAWDGVVQAHTMDGALLWSFEVSEALGLGQAEGWITDLAPLPGALAVAGAGHVLCLEEAP